MPLDSDLAPLSKSKSTSVTVTVPWTALIPVALVIASSLVATYVQAQRTGDNVEQIKADVKDVKLEQTAQRAQLTSIASDGQVLTYRVNQLERKQ